MPARSLAQNWKENSGTEWNYDLEGVRILAVIYEGFNYEEAIDICDYWKKWGANVDLAGTRYEQHGERNNPATGKPHDQVPVILKPDMLLSETDYREYDLVYFPGGEGVGIFLKEKRSELKQLIDGVVADGGYVAAICHAPLLLAASENLKGCQVTVQGSEYRPELTKAGARIVNKIFVSDGNFMTGQWPYFETFAASVAEKLLYPQGNGPFEISRKKNGPVLNRYLDQSNIFLMRQESISDDTIKLILKYSVNPVLPFEMMNNSTTKFIAVKDSILKTLISDQLVEAGIQKFKAENVSADAIKRLWTMIFRAPVIIFVYSDISGINPEDKDCLSGLLFSVAGQCVSQMGQVAGDLGFGVSVIGGIRSLIAEEGIGNVLNAPAGYKLVNIVGIGHPVEYANPAVIRPVSDYLIIK